MRRAYVESRSATVMHLSEFCNLFEIRRERQSFKLVDSEILVQTVTSYIDWDPTGVGRRLNMGFHSREPILTSRVSGRDRIFLQSDNLGWSGKQPLSKTRKWERRQFSCRKRLPPKPWVEKFSRSELRSLNALRWRQVAPNEKPD
jgi:hypothetical protein